MTKLKLLSFFANRIGEEMDAAITGVDRRGFYCRGLKIPVEGRVMLQDIPGGHQLQYNREAHLLASRRGGRSFQLGGLVRVKVVLVDQDRRELQFTLLNESVEARSADRGNKTEFTPQLSDDNSRRHRRPKADGAPDRSPKPTARKGKKPPGAKKSQRKRK